MFIFGLILIGLILLILIYIFSIDRIPPEPPTNLQWEIKQIMAKQARVKLSWNLSISTDVASQHLKVETNIFTPDPSEVIVDTDIDAVTSEFIVVLKEKDFVRASLEANDLNNSSPTAILDFEVPDLAEPAAPTWKLPGWEIVEILPGEV